MKIKVKSKSGVSHAKLFHKLQRYDVIIYDTMQMPNVKHL